MSFYSTPGFLRVAVVDFPGPQRQQRGLLEMFFLLQMLCIEFVPSSSKIE